jgi:hypothetical protein
LRALAIISLSMFAAACGGGGGGAGDGGGDTGGDPSPADLCVQSSCGTKTTLVSIPQAENIFFTDDGRLFVDGSTNVFEITGSGDTFTATPIYAGAGNFGGMAQRGNVLYVTNFTDGALYAAQLTLQPQLQAIHALNMASPNGMTAGPDGELYIVNGPLSTSSLPDPRVVRLRFDPSDPMHVTEQVDWITTGLSFPNGIARKDRALFIMDSEPLPPVLGSIVRVDIGDDGSPGALQTLTTFPSLPDDLSVVADDLLVAYYSNSQIALYTQQGALVSSTDPLSFQNPSQVKIGRPPMFSATDILVTEKGIVGDDVTPLGDKLSVFRKN